MKIRKDVYELILKSYPVPPPEQGGIIGMKNGEVCAYFHDEGTVHTDCAVYEPDTDLLNRVISCWSEAGIEFCGIVHSHMKGQGSLSSADREYISLVTAAFSGERELLWFPLVIPEERRMLVFSVCIKNENVCILEDTADIIN